MSASANISTAAGESGARPIAQRDGPTGVRSPTVIALHSAGWLLLACLFLPVCHSCGGTVVRPVDSLKLSPPVRAPDLMWRAMLLGVYGNGVLIAGLITISAWKRSRVFWWQAFLVQFAVTLGTALAILSLIAIYATSLEQWLEDTLLILPMVGGGMTWVASAMRHGERGQAWARLQHLWTIEAYFELHLQCIFSSGLMYGYWVTLLALAGQVFAVELARHRMDHDLWDKSHPPRRPQFSLGSLFFWMTVLPLVFGYYQAVDPVVEWLFPGE